MNVVKETIGLIIERLTNVMNLSLSSGAIPDNMMIALVIPLFKSSVLSLFTNYRLVSYSRPLTLSIMM